MIEKFDAIKALRPDAIFSVRGNGVVEWADSNETDVPTDVEISAKIEEMQPIEDLNKLRAERNQRLANTDWWASSDLTMTEAQTAYRQALRDITDTYTSLDDVVWPEEPNGTI